MRYGVFSDVHSNLEAFSAVLEFFQKNAVDGYICLGDMVGYGPDPEGCLGLLGSLKNLVAVIGNHDLAALGIIDPNWFNPYARAAVMWSRRELSDRSRAFLGGLQARLDHAEFTLVHGAPRRPAEEYLLTLAQFKENMSHVHKWPLFVGHSHMPLYFRVLSERAPGRSTVDVEMNLIEPGGGVVAERKPYGVVPMAFNPGSVGQPRDQDPRASCAIYDSERMSFQAFKCEYDIQTTQEKIRQAGLPEFLAARLRFGT